HWIQPADQINNNRHATPVELAQSGKNVWRGRVEPLESRLSFDLSIQQGDGGLLTAVIRNPQFNLFRRNLDRFERRGNELTFSDATYSSSNFEAKLDASGAQFEAHLPNVDGELIFKRQDIGPGSHGHYKYRPPAEMGDGWRVAHLKDVNLDSTQIAG